MAEIPFYVHLNLNKQQLLNAGFQIASSAPLSPVTGQFYFNSTDANFWGFNGTSWVNLSQIVTNALSIKGEITNASTNPALPASPAVGDIWFVTTTAGNVGTFTVEIGDQLIFGTSGWFVLQANLQAASTTIAGFIRLATQAEVNAGTLTGVAVSPATLITYLTNAKHGRKAVTTIASLAANTPTTVTHGLNLAAAEEVQVNVWQGGVDISAGIRKVVTTVNALTVESNVALSNVTVVSVG